MPRFSANIEASFLKTVVAVGPMPPVAANTNGEKQALSYLSNTFIICLSFLMFKKLITSGQLGMKIGACKKFKHPDIEKCTLPILTPKVSGNKIKMGTIFSIGSSKLQYDKIIFLSFLWATVKVLLTLFAVENIMIRGIQVGRSLLCPKFYLLCL